MPSIQRMKTASRPPKIVSSRISFADDPSLSIYDFTDRLRHEEMDQISAFPNSYRDSTNPITSLNIDHQTLPRNSQNTRLDVSTTFTIHPEAYSEDIKEKFLSPTEVVYSFTSNPDSSEIQTVENENSSVTVEQLASMNTETSVRLQNRRSSATMVSSSLSHIDRLVLMAIPKRGYVPTQEFLFSFFLSIRRYMNIRDVLPKIVERIFVVRTSADVDITSRSNHIMFVISYWITTMPYDFRDPDLMKSLKQLFMVCLKYNPSCYFDIRFIIGMLLKELKRLDIHESDRDRRYQPNISLVRESIIDECKSSLTLAEQLYIIEAEHLRYIGPEEYIQYLNMNKKSSADFKKRTFNIEAYVRWVNRLSYFTTTEVVKQLRKRKRASVIEYFIDVIDYSLKMKNYNSAMAIITGLDDSSVRRMTNTWDSVASNYFTRFTYYKSLLNVSNNFSSYRRALEFANNEDPASTSIPFFCVSLKDMHYVSEVMPDLLNNGLINYEKMYKIASLVAQLNKQSKTINVNYRKQPYILELLQTMMIFDSSMAMEASLKCEKDKS